MEYTPGPWERRGEYGLEIWEYQAPEPAVEGEEDAGDDGSGWLSVCTVHEPGEANARLIAAAPEMYDLLAEVERWTCDDWDDESFAHWQSDVSALLERHGLLAAKGDA